MENPSYDTVPGYITVGSHIVRAIRSDIPNVALTGLVVDVPTRKFPSIDSLEAGYDRIKVNTTGGFETYMYAVDGNEVDYSSYRSSFYEQ